VPLRCRLDAQVERRRDRAGAATHSGQPVSLLLDPPGEPADLSTARVESAPGRPRGRDWEVLLFRVVGLDLGQIGLPRIVWTLGWG
jgi:hypothetical protein